MVLDGVPTKSLSPGDIGGHVVDEETFGRLGVGKALAVFEKAGLRLANTRFRAEVR